MFVDASVLVALLSAEPDTDPWIEKLTAAKVRYTSGIAIIETVMRVSALLDVDPEVVETHLQALLEEAEILVISVTASIAGKAVGAAAAYGEGRPNAAQLTLAQCVSYACAQAYRVPLLFRGGGFAQTDVRPA